MFKLKKRFMEFQFLAKQLIKFLKKLDKTRID
jgi:hypothetical protein